jgi:hypothetical protein
MNGDLFVVGVAILQSLAFGSYVWSGHYREALVWAGAAVSNIAYLTLVRM